MIVLWIVLGVVALLIVVGFVSEGKVKSSPQPSKATEAIAKPGRADAPRTPQPVGPYTSPTCGNPPRETVSDTVDPTLLAAAQQDVNRHCFQILGACFSRGHSDRVVAGTVFRVEDRNGVACVVRGNGMPVGWFPPNVERQYREMPDGQRYRRVVVSNDCDLNDRYGRCFVYPVFA